MAGNEKEHSPPSLGEGKPKGVLKTIHTAQLKGLKERLSELTTSLDPFYNRESKVAQGEVLIQLWRTLSSLGEGKAEGRRLGNLPTEKKHQTPCLVNQLPLLLASDALGRQSYFL